MSSHATDLSVYAKSSSSSKGIQPVTSWVLVCWWRWLDWHFARLIAPVVTTTSLSLAPVKPANPGSHGNMAVKMERDHFLYQLTLFVQEKRAVKLLWLSSLYFAVEFTFVCIVGWNFRVSSTSAKVTCLSHSHLRSASPSSLTTERLITAVLCTIWRVGFEFSVFLIIWNDTESHVTGCDSIIMPVMFENLVWR